MTDSPPVPEATGRLASGGEETEDDRGEAADELLSPLIDSN
jgi:hypothetical protein